MSHKPQVSSCSRSTSADLSIIVPVLGEHATIHATLAHLQGLAFSGQRQIIIVDGAADGATIAGIHRPEVTCVAGPRGRAVQMNTGAALAGGRVLLFVHADTFLPPRALDLAMAAMENQGAAAGAFGLGIDADRPAYRLIETMANWRSRYCGLPYGDQAVFVKKNVFDALGGFRPMALMEDVDLMRRLNKAGRRVVLIPDRVATSARRWEKEGIVYTTLRNWMLLALFLSGVAPERLVRWYP